jgi:hypothetical protein
MTMSKNSTPFVVGAVFVILGAAWFATRDSQPKVGVKTLSVPSMAKGDITAVTITIPGKETKPEGAPDTGPVVSERAPSQTVVLKKDGAGFVVSDEKTPDKRFPVDDAQLESLLEAVAELAPGDRIANDKDKLKAFEIDDEQALRVQVEATGTKGIDLLFGRAAKSGGTTVRQKGSSDVFVAKGRLGMLAKKDLNAWRKKTLVTKKANELKSITITPAEGAPLVLTSTTTTPEAPPAPPPAEGDEATPPPPPPKTTWALTEPAALPANFRLDEGALSRVASSFASLRAADFADGVSDADAGLSGAHVVVSAVAADDQKITLHLGGADDKKRVYARLDGDAQLYLLAEYSAKNINKALDDLRDMTLLTADVGDVVSATFSAGANRVVVKKGADGWSVFEPKKAPAEIDVAQIGQVVQSALRLRGTRFLGDVKTTGAGPQVELVLSSGKKQVLRFYGPVEEGSSDVVVVGADGNAYAISGYQKGRYEKPVELFKKPPTPPPGMGGGGGGISGLESLPPDVRKKLEASLKAQGMGGP